MQLSIFITFYTLEFLRSDRIIYLNDSYLQIKQIIHMTFLKLSFCFKKHSLTLKQLTIFGLNLAKLTLGIVRKNCYKAFEKF